MLPPGLHSVPRVRNEAFELALQKHLDNLGVKPGLPWFQASGPQEIVDFIQGQQNAYQKTSKLHRSVDYWNSKIIEPLRQFFYRRRSGCVLPSRNWGNSLGMH